MKRKPLLKFPIRINCEREIAKSLTLSADVTFQASSDAGKKPKISMIANTGKPMRLRGFFDPVIVDISGARFDKKTTPIIMDHDVKLRLGHTTTQSIDKGQYLINADGVISSSSASAKEFLADANEGFPFQVSIGADIIEGTYVEEGEKITVNGQVWEGPLIVASKTLIRELTVTVLGADSDTSAKVTAKRSIERNRTMDFEAYVASLGLTLSELSEEVKNKLKAEYDRVKKLEASDHNTDPPKNKKKIKAKAKPDPEEDDEDDDDTEIQARRKKFLEDDERLDRIREIAAEYEDSVPEEFTLPGQKKPTTLKKLKAEALRDGNFTSDAFELALMRASRTSLPDAPSPHMVNKEIESNALQASILRHFGVPEKGLNKDSGKEYGLRASKANGGFTDKELEASHGKQYNVGGSIQALLDVQIRAAGDYYSSSDRRSKSFLAAAVKSWEKVQASGFSTLNITNILENAMHKVALSSFLATEGVWGLICGRKPLNDFKTHSMYRLDPSGAFKKVGIDGELKHVGMTDTKMTISADTYGAMITIDYKTIRNDDLGLVVQQCRDIGMLGAQRIEESVFVTLLGSAGAGAFFNTTNNNYLSSGTYALSMSALEAARLKFKNQVINGKPVGVSPRLLITGTTNETLANQLYNEEKLMATGDTDALIFTNNPNKGLYRPVISPWVNNTSITDQDGASITGQSSTKWWLAADPTAPQGSMLVIGFLDGRETPYFDEAETSFNVPRGMSFRSYLDWGVALNTYQMGLLADGA